MSEQTFRLFVAGEWVEGSDGGTEPVINPATEETIGVLCHAGADDLARAVRSAEALRIGDGLDPETQMGRLANDRRVAA